MPQNVRAGSGYNPLIILMGDLRGLEGAPMNRYRAAVLRVSELFPFGRVIRNMKYDDRLTCGSWIAHVP